MREGIGRHPRSHDRPDATTSKRDALVRNISKRLRPVCSKMPATEFDAMVQQMADIELKYANQTTPTYPADRGD